MRFTRMPQKPPPGETSHRGSLGCALVLLRWPNSWLVLFLVTNGKLSSLLGFLGPGKSDGHWQNLMWWSPDDDNGGLTLFFPQVKRPGSPKYGWIGAILAFCDSGIQFKHWGWTKSWAYLCLKTLPTMPYCLLTKSSNKPTCRTESHWVQRRLPISHVLRVAALFCFGQLTPNLLAHS